MVSISSTFSTIWSIASMRDIVSSSSSSYTTYVQGTGTGLTDLLTFSLRDIGVWPAFLLAQRFPRNTILTTRPEPEVNEAAALGTEGICGRVRPRDLACTVWALAAKRPSHMFLPATAWAEGSGRTLSVHPPRPQLNGRPSP